MFIIIVEVGPDGVLLSRVGNVFPFHSLLLQPWVPHCFHLYHLFGVLIRADATSDHFWPIKQLNTICCMVSCIVWATVILKQKQKMDDPFNLISAQYLHPIERFRISWFATINKFFLLRKHRYRAVAVGSGIILTSPQNLDLDQTNCYGLHASLLLFFFFIFLFACFSSETNR